MSEEYNKIRYVCDPSRFSVWYNDDTKRTYFYTPNEKKDTCLDDYEYRYLWSSDILFFNYLKAKKRYDKLANPYEADLFIPLLISYIQNTKKQCESSISFTNGTPTQGILDKELFKQSIYENPNLLSYCISALQTAQPFTLLKQFRLRHDILVKPRNQKKIIHIFLPILCAAQQCNMLIPKQLERIQNVQVYTPTELSNYKRCEGELMMIPRGPDKKTKLKLLDEELAKLNPNFIPIDDVYRPRLVTIIKKERNTCTLPAWELKNEVNSYFPRPVDQEIREQLYEILAKPMTTTEFIANQASITVNDTCLLS